MQISNYSKCHFLNYKFLVISLKKLIIPTLLFLFIISLILFSKTNTKAVAEGLTLWITSVVPSLFPFFIATELLGYTDIVRIIGKYLEPIMRPIFNVPGICSYPLVMGLITGYPTGAKIVSNLLSNNLCSKEEAERMISFTNNSGPLFIFR